MSDNKKQMDALVRDVVSVVKESNKLARKRNRIAKRQYQQSVLNFEQVERQYLIEKSRLQPSFTLSVSEFLTCEPDFVNDPEQASEVKFLFDQGIGYDQRILRVKLTVKGDEHYMQPNLVIPQTQSENDVECAFAMSDLLYFIPVERITISDSSFVGYLVYKDKTTLPVIHQYRFDQRVDSTLLRWDVAHLDTAYASSHARAKSLEKTEGCAELFKNRG